MDRLMYPSPETNEEAYQAASCNPYQPFSFDDFP
jgi:hypothetical protein